MLSKWKKCLKNVLAEHGLYASPGSLDGGRIVRLASEILEGLLICNNMQLIMNYSPLGFEHIIVQVIILHQSFNWHSNQMGQAGFIIKSPKHTKFFYPNLRLKFPLKQNLSSVNLKVEVVQKNCLSLNLLRKDADCGSKN